MPAPVEAIPIDLNELEVADTDGDDDVAADALSDEDLLALEAGPDLTEQVAELIDGQGEDMAGILRSWMAGSNAR